jgi:hypothetical protein
VGLGATAAVPAAGAGAAEHVEHRQVRCCCGGSLPCAVSYGRCSTWCSILDELLPRLEPLATVILCSATRADPPASCKHIQLQRRAELTTGRRGRSAWR